MEIYVINDNQLVLIGGFLLEIWKLREELQDFQCVSFAGWGSIHTKDVNSLISKLNTSFAVFERFKVVPFA